jgi:N-acetyl-anhydromuramyl-L-alanine amidase AmpD
MADVISPPNSISMNVPVVGAATATAMAFAVGESAMLPVEDGQAVTPGWPAKHGFQPLGVTWHWTVTWDLSVCRQVLGGRSAERKGIASAHYAVGRSFAEGIDRYVALENRSWHAGKNQTVRWDGRRLEDPDFKGSRSTVGVETVSIGCSEGVIRPRPDWIQAHSPDGKQLLHVQPWTEEQVAMMVWVGKEIQARFPRIGLRDHHGHHDLCPGYKIDVAGFPFARVLSGIYGIDVPDIWSSTWLVVQRQRVLHALGYNLGPKGADGAWGPGSDRALRLFQAHVGLYDNGMWNTATAWRAYDVLGDAGIRLADAAEGLR